MTYLIRWIGVAVTLDKKRKAGNIRNLLDYKKRPLSTLFLFGEENNKNNVKIDHDLLKPWSQNKYKYIEWWHALLTPAVTKR